MTGTTEEDLERLRSGRTHRYQPVQHREDDSVSLCEVYLNEDGTLSAWTQDMVMAAIGNDVEDLMGELLRMVKDASRWMPVYVDELKVGLRFEKRW